MFKKYFYCAFALQVIGYSHAYTAVQSSAILARLGPTFQDCINEAQVSQLQFDAALREKNVNLVSPCFFNCVLSKTDLFFTVFGKQALNIIAIMELLPQLVPTVTPHNIPITEELTKCAFRYFFSRDTDDFPVCGRTSVLVNCLAGASNLNNAIKQAIAIQ